MKPVKVIGGGLAGCEAAWQLARRNIPVQIHEMRPQKMTPAHRTGQLSELVCSNSLKSVRIDRAHGLLKEEIRMAGSLLLDAADECSIPGGTALVVDRARFAALITSRLEANPLVEIIRDEVKELEPGEYTIVSAGPLVSDTLAGEIEKLLGSGSLSFYDAIAPTVDAESLNREKVFVQDRYGDPGEGSYINCPFDKEEYKSFIEAIKSGRTVPLHSFEGEQLFEACLPIEVLASRGDQTLAFGPMRPVGLTDPRTGTRPYAVVQLRPENMEKTQYSFVGFQTKLTHPEQERVFRTIPGLEKATFERLGSIHRNTFLDSPRLLDEFQRPRKAPHLFFSGQICGVEGYTESMASGAMTGIYVSSLVLGVEPAPPPATTMTGALLKQLTIPPRRTFQPVNAQFGLLSTEGISERNKKKKRELLTHRAIEHMSSYLSQTGIGIDS
ncbi:MAG: methylenetetrahydrofolate--tRNA-(uracil(54)-C(5))-methyltransferase (FADH(2)-oxidizing) TrmFO [bacterium]